jgi:hypothetical protein
MISVHPTEAYLDWHSTTRLRDALQREYGFLFSIPASTEKRNPYFGADTFDAESLMDPRLEEVEPSEDGRYWHVTVSFFRAKRKSRSSRAPIAGPDRAAYAA